MGKRLAYILDAGRRKLQTHLCGGRKRLVTTDMPNCGCGGGGGNPGNTCCKCWFTPIEESSMGPGPFPPLGRYNSPRTEIRGEIFFSWSKLLQDTSSQSSGIDRVQTEWTRSAGATYTLFGGVRLPTPNAARCGPWGRTDGFTPPTETFLQDFTDTVRPDLSYVNRNVTGQSSYFSQISSSASTNVFNFGSGSYTSPVLRPFDQTVDGNSNFTRTVRGGPMSRGQAPNKSEMRASFGISAGLSGTHEYIGVEATDPVIDGQGPVWGATFNYNKLKLDQNLTNVAGTPQMSVNVVYAGASKGFYEMAIDMEMKHQFDVTVPVDFSTSLYKRRAKWDIVMRGSIFIRADVYACLNPRAEGPLDPFGNPMMIEDGFDMEAERRALLAGGCCGQPGA